MLLKVRQLLNEKYFTEFEGGGGSVQQTKSLILKNLKDL